MLNLLKIKDMIKIIKENGDVHYLNKDALIQIKYCKRRGTLIAHPINAKSPEITLEGVQHITDAEIEEIIKKEDYYNEPIKEVLNHVRNDRSHYCSVYLAVQRAIEDLKITTVGELLDLGPSEFSNQRGVGPASLEVVHEALWDLYKINW